MFGVDESTRNWQLYIAIVGLYVATISLAI